VGSQRRIPSGQQKDHRHSKDGEHRPEPSEAIEESATSGRGRRSEWTAHVHRVPLEAI
jgi:hypothetical protein